MDETLLDATAVRSLEGTSEFARESFSSGSDDGGAAERISCVSLFSGAACIVTSDIGGEDGAFGTFETATS